MGETKEYAERLKVIQKELGISVKKLAEISGIPPTTLQKWIYLNVIPPVDKLERLARATGANPYFLIFGEGPPILGHSSEDSEDKKEIAVKKRPKSY